MTKKEKKKASDKKYYEENKEKLNAKNKIYREKNKENIKEYLSKNKEKIAVQSKERRLKNKEKIAVKQKEWRLKNKEKIKEYNQEYNQENKEKIAVQSKEYKLKNKENIKEYNQEYNQEKKEKILARRKERKNHDPLFKLKCNLRTRTSQAFKLKGWTKTSRTYELLGADYETVMNHIEQQFEDWMTWDNHGEWHIDHIVPLRIADNEEDLKELCHYSNLQPLSAFDNMSKGGRI